VIQKTVLWGIRAGFFFFYNFHKYHTKILLGDFNAKVGRYISKSTIRNEGLY
jgi:hypothetical protein